MAIKIQGDNSTSNPGVTNSTGTTGMSVQDGGATVSVFGTPTAKFATNGVYLAESGGPTVRFLNGDSPDKAFGGDGTKDYAITSTGGNLEIRCANDTFNQKVVEFQQGTSSTTSFWNDKYRFYEGSNASNIAEGNYLEFNPRSDASDPDRAVIRYVKPGEYGGEAVYNFDDQGYVRYRGGLFVGEQRSDADTPVTQYPDLTSYISITRGADGNTAARQMRHLWQNVQSTDTGDISTYEYWNSLNGGSMDTSNSASSHLRFTMKLNGMIQSRSTIFAGRVENDSGSPVSAYASATSINAYGDSSGGVTYLRGDNNPTTSNYAYYVDNDNAGGSSSNAYTGVKFKVRAYDGRIYQDYGSTFSNADYAEYFEWYDGNPNDEYRGGHSVVLIDGTDKIRIATSNDNPDDIIGIVSVAPGVVGDAYDLHWQGAYKKDQFGKPELTPVQVYKWNPCRSDDQPTNEFQARHAQEGIAVDKLDEAIANGTYGEWVRDVAYEITDYVRTKNEDWDRSVEYTPREERPEWTPVGLVGKLWLKPNEPAGTRWKLLKTDTETGNKLWLVR